MDAAARLIRLFALRTQQPGEPFDVAIARARVQLPTIAALAGVRAASAAEAGPERG